MNIANKNKSPLPIGISFFDKVIEGGYYYVDKTLFIKDLLDIGAAVTLCTRPRRFGKTLNQMMLKCFFEDTKPICGKDKRSLFSGLKIGSAGNKYMEHQGIYPVVFLSFKGAKLDTFQRSYNYLKDQLSEEFKRHYYVLEKINDNSEIELFKRLASQEGTRDEYEQSLKFLCKCLEQYHNQKTIILIDEYDVPLENAWVQFFYQEMIDFIRPVLTEALKDNIHLQFSVITGCLRVSKESIFTGLNNIDIISILSDRYDDCFGFTQIEVDEMLKYYGLENKEKIIKEWYNGYIFGRKEVYNPWSVIKVTANWAENPNRYPEPHWANTSSNDIVRHLLDNANNTMKDEIESLLSGATISKIIHEDVTYNEIELDPDNIWNFLFFTGYLKKESERLERVNLILELSIPNLELQYIYQNKISEWFNEQISKKNLDTFYNAVITGNTELFEKELTDILGNSISFMDSAENFYHGFMAGLLNRLNGYKITSNRESGKGRNDLVAHAISKKGKAVIFEFKTVKKFKDLSMACDDALKQIEDMNYAAHWLDEGYTDIMKYGIAFCGKDCKVKINNG